MNEIHHDLSQKIEALKGVVDTSHTILVYGWVIFISLFGGTVSYLSKVAQGTVTFSLFKFLVELGCAAFLGLLTASFAHAQSMSWEMAGGLAGIAAHMGSRALFLLDYIAMRKFEKLTGETFPKDILKEEDTKQ